MSLPIQSICWTNYLETGLLLALGCLLVAGFLEDKDVIKRCEPMHRMLVLSCKQLLEDFLSALHR